MTDKDLAQAIGLLRALDHFMREAESLCERIGKGRVRSSEFPPSPIANDPESLRYFLEKEIIRKAKQSGPASFIILSGEKEDGR